MAPQIARFLAIEPAREWWADNIAGAPADFIMPTALGDVPLGDGGADLAVSLGVLHHIPNVSSLIEELARVLAPGGLLILREPISTMGDWRKPRRGLTRNERGLPLCWLRQELHKAGFDIVRSRLCMFGPAQVLARKLGLRRPFNSGSFVALDHLLSEMFRWNVRYHRTGIARKFAAGSVFIIARKKGGGATVRHAA